MYCELWGPSRPYKPNQWAHIVGMGWLGCKDGRILREMGGPVGEAGEVKEEREAGGAPPPFQAPPPPSQERQRSQSEREEEEVRVGVRPPLRQPHFLLFLVLLQRRSPPAPPAKKATQPPPEVKVVHATKSKGGARKTTWGGGGRLGGGGASLPSPIICGQDRAAGAHTQKSGGIWVKYPNNSKLYDVERHVPFGTAKPAKRTSKRCAWARPPPPTLPQRSLLTPCLTPKKTVNATKPTRATHLSHRPATEGTPEQYI